MSKWKIKIGDIIEYKGEAGLMVREDREHYYVRWFGVIGEWCYVKAMQPALKFARIS